MKLKKKWKIVLALSIAVAIIACSIWLIFFNPNESLGKDKYGCEYIADWYEKTYGFQFYRVNIVNKYTKINGELYRMILLDDRILWGLMTEEYADKMMYSEARINRPADWARYEIFRRDLGLYVGRTSGGAGYLPAGLRVFHYAAYPNSDDILIVEFGDHFGYAFYIRDDTGGTMDGTVIYDLTS